MAGTRAASLIASFNAANEEEEEETAEPLVAVSPDV